MKPYQLKKNLLVYCLHATSFPDGIADAHKKLQELTPFLPQRQYFGISYPGRAGEIIYQVGATEHPEGALRGLGLEAFTTKQGDYLYLDVPDFSAHLGEIGHAFKKLTAVPEIDPSGACIEWYLNQKDCRCMVRTVAQNHFESSTK